MPTAQRTRHRRPQDAAAVPGDRFMIAGVLPVVLVGVVVVPLGLVGLGLASGYLRFGTTVFDPVGIERGQGFIAAAMVTAAIATLLTGVLGTLFRGRTGRQIWIGLIIGAVIWTVLLIVFGLLATQDMASRVTG
ncbi:hypothetical protein DVJ78_18355 (plasmid) [Humibacter sp. BT305]|nr:hypothetical protein DVJ78_18355 [Humibacter sp. BT305]